MREAAIFLFLIGIAVTEAEDEIASNEEHCPNPNIKLERVGCFKEEASEDRALKIQVSEIIWFQLYLSSLKVELLFLAVVAEFSIQNALFRVYRLFQVLNTQFHCA